MKFKAWLLAGAILAGSVFIACGDDDDDDDDAADTATSAATTAAPATTEAPETEEPTETEATEDGTATATGTGTGGSSELAAYFAELDSLEQAIDEGFESDVFTAENAKAGIDAFSSLVADYQSGLDALEPPSEVEEQHQDLITAVESVSTQLEELSAETGEDVPLEELEGLLFSSDIFAEVDEASCALTDIAESEGIELEFFTCDAAPSAEEAGDNAVTVDGAEYSFTITGELATDTSGIVFENTGEEQHELALYAVEEGIDIEQVLMEAQESQAEEFPDGFTEVGGTFAFPGDNAGLPFEEPLEAGRYALFCFVPDSAGVPHAFLGMWEEVTVE